MIYCTTMLFLTAKFENVRLSKVMIRYDILSDEALLKPDLSQNEIDSITQLVKDYCFTAAGRRPRALQCQVLACPSVEQNLYIYALESADSPSKYNKYSLWDFKDSEYGIETTGLFDVTVDIRLSSLCASHPPYYTITTVHTGNYLPTVV